MSKGRTRGVGDAVAADLAMLVDAETSGRPLDDVLAAHGRSRSTYYEKLRRYRAEGIAGLAPRPPGPRNRWRRTSEVVRLILEARLDDPGRSAAAIARGLRGRGFSVSVRSVERTLAEHRQGQRR